MDMNVYYVNYLAGACGVHGEAKANITRVRIAKLPHGTYPQRAHCHTRLDRCQHVIGERDSSLPIW